MMMKQTMLMYYDYEAGEQTSSQGVYKGENPGTDISGSLPHMTLALLNAIR